MFRPRHSGSRGTDTSRWPPRATRAISASVWSGSGTCSSTSIADASSNSPSANGIRSAFMIRYSRLGSRRLSHSAWITASSRSIPTTRPSRRRCAHFWVSTPSPQPTSRTERGEAFAHSSSSVRSKPAISFLTTGLDDPYLSYVLPVTVPSASRVIVDELIAPPSPVCPECAAGPAVAACRARSQLHLLSLFGVTVAGGVRAGGRRPAVRAGAGLVVRRRDPAVELQAPDALEHALQ